MIQDNTQSIQSVAIVGAGMAGTTCAVGLAVEIPNITIFESASRAGGRMCSRVEDGFQFDYGAQYFTTHDSQFSERVKYWNEEWLADEWQAWVVDLQNGKAMSHEEGVHRYVARPGMESLAEQASELCSVVYNTLVTRLERQGDAWQLFDAENCSLGVYDAVILAIPPAQVAALITDDLHMWQESLQAIEMLPCWSVMLGFSEALNTGFDAAFVIDSELSWIARNNSKPERLHSESWVLHGSYEWTEHQTDISEEQAIELLFDAMQRATAMSLPEPIFKAAHLWHHAAPLNPLNTPCLYEEKLRLGACGDWCVGPRVEGAFVSGLAMAEALLA